MESNERGVWDLIGGFFWGLGEREGRKGKGVGWDGVRGRVLYSTKVYL
jgi:hypothetical protein